MKTSNHFDVAVIGSGAGGGTLVHALAPTGKKILLLERGDWLRREKGNWSAKAVFLEGRYNNSEEWVDIHGKRFQPGQHYFVGGNTKFYGAALLRFRREDFGEIRHHGGVSPAWPINYNDIEPYYTRAEHLYHVHGEHGTDPTEAEASAQYKYPPLTHEPRVEELAAGLRKMGHKPFPLPVGIMLDEAHPESSPCIRCDTCDGFPCLVQAKADAEIVAVRPALDYKNVTLLTNTCVRRLETSAGGREVTKLKVTAGGEPMEFSADIVVSSCGAINSAALLLRSANDKHPNGLANRSGQVGRNYMAHNNSAFVALSLRPNPTLFQKTLGLNDFYFGSDDFEFPLGHIQMLGKSSADMFAADAPSFTPHGALDQMAKHALDLWMTSEDLPDPENRVTLDSEGRICLHYRENNIEGHKRLVAKLKWMLSHLGCHEKLIPQNVYIGKKIPLAGVAHQNGTVRFGADPQASVLDVNCKAHELDNLYVVDGSFFPSSTAVNPGLTIMANALRVAEHLKQRLG